MTQSIMIMKRLISIILYMYTYDNRMHVRFDLFLQPKQNYWIVSLLPLICSGLG